MVNTCDNGAIAALGRHTFVIAHRCMLYAYTRLCAGEAHVKWDNIMIHPWLNALFPTGKSVHVYKCSPLVYTVHFMHKHSDHACMKDSTQLTIHSKQSGKQIIVHCDSAIWACMMTCMLSALGLGHVGELRRE